MACALFAFAPAAGAQGVDVSSTTRLEKVMASIRARDPRAAAGLADGFDAEPRPAIRAWIVRGVAALGAPQGPDFFRHALRDPDAMVRLNAAEGLAKTEKAKADSELIAALGTEANGGVRIAIVGLLGGIKTAAAVAALEQALASDPDPNVRVSAARSLQRQGGAARQAVRAFRNDRDKRVRGIANEP